MMKKNKTAIFILMVFINVFVLHLLYFKFKFTKGSCGSISWFQEYLKGQDYFLGISYALSFAFMIFAFFKFKENRKSALKAAMGSGLLTILLWLSCFLFGCCGSPMLIMYLNLIGISSLKVPKVFLLLMTVIFIVIGYIYLLKKLPEVCCSDKSCRKEKNEKN